MRGRLDEHVIASAALRGNRLGDPAERPLWVYTPPGYDDDPGRRFPAVYVIQGFTGQLDGWRNRNPMRPLFTEQVDELFSDGATPQCLVVFVDCWTSLGGSQFVDSPATGRYHTYLCDEVVAFVESYRTLPAAAHRGVAGKSSGGYGAMITPMLRPDLWGGLATHPATLCSRPATPATSHRARGCCATATTARTTASSRTSAAGSRSLATATTCCSTPTPWPPVTRRTPTAPCACRS
jgi:enterochelin esterase-like enzyme